MASRPSFYILSLLTATRITNFRVLPRSRVSYARQIAVMTVHRGKKCHVRGKQNVSRAYVLSSLSSSHPLLTSSPLLAHTARRCLWSVAFSAIPCLSLSYTYMRGSRVVFAGGRGRGPTSREPMSRRNDYVSPALVHRSMKSNSSSDFRGKKILMYLNIGLISNGF